MRSLSELFFMLFWNDVSDLKPFRVLSQLTGFYSITAWIFEFLMVVSHGCGLVLFLMDHSTIIMTLIPILVLTLLYLLISFISSAIQDGYAKIDECLYASLWYWMPHKERKLMWQIMMVAQKSKVVKVGIFGDSNLERFSKVRS